MFAAIRIPIIKKITLSLAVIFIIFISFPILPSNAASNTDSSRIERGTFKPQSSISSSAQIVHVGIEPTEVYGINLADGTWRANFYVWWRWSGDIDPSTTTYFTNNADAAVSQSIKYAYTDSEGKPKPLMQSNGEKYQYAYVRMGFVEDYQLKRFPLDSQYLTMKIENDTYASNYLAYVFDYEHLSTEKFIPTNGWVSKGFKTAAFIHHYTTDFGFIDEGSAFQDYSHLTFSMEIQREKMYFYLKLFLPLVIVLTATLAALMVRQMASKTPLALASTGLLTTIFAQQNYSQDLPPQAPLVLIDKIYLAILLIVIIVFLRVVLRTQKFKAGDSLDQSAFMGSKSDFIFALSLFLVFGAVSSFLVAL